MTTLASRGARPRPAPCVLRRALGAAAARPPASAVGRHVVLHAVDNWRGSLFLGVSVALGTSRTARAGRRGVRISAMQGGLDPDLAAIDLYAVLGVERSADTKAMKKAFRALALQWHPDVNRTAGAEEKFVAIKRAYKVLSDTDLRLEVGAVTVYVVIDST